MSHYYAEIPTSARKTTPTACGHKSTGVTVEAKTWESNFRTRLFWSEEIGANCVMIEHIDIATGKTQELYAGVC